MIERYTLSKMGNIWSEKHKMEIMLKIEVLACEAMCKLGLIPKKSIEKIKKSAKFDIDEVKKLEEKTKHDVVAFINNVGQYIGAEPSTFIWANIFGFVGYLFIRSMYGS